MFISSFSRERLNVVLYQLPVLLERINQPYEIKTLLTPLLPLGGRVMHCPLSVRPSVRTSVWSCNSKTWGLGKLKFCGKISVPRVIGSAVLNWRGHKITYTRSTYWCFTFQERKDVESLYLVHSFWMALIIRGNFSRSKNQVTAGLTKLRHEILHNLRNVGDTIF